MSGSKKCPNCGACKECGAHPQIVPMPYPVNPWCYPQPRAVPYVQPHPPWTSYPGGSVTGKSYTTWPVA